MWPGSPTMNFSRRISKVPSHYASREALLADLPIPSRPEWSRAVSWGTLGLP
jgi:hypothetical protein